MEQFGIVREQQWNSPGTAMEQSQSTAELDQPVPLAQEPDLFDGFLDSAELAASEGFESIGCNEFKRRYSLNNHQFYELKAMLEVKDTSKGLSPTMHKAFKRMAEKRGWIKESAAETVVETGEVSEEVVETAVTIESGELATVQSETLPVSASAPVPFIVENLTINIKQADTQRLDTESDRLYAYTQEGIQNLKTLVSNEFLTDIQNVRAINRHIASGVQAEAISNAVRTVGNDAAPVDVDGSNDSAGGSQ